LFYPAQVFLSLRGDQGRTIHLKRKAEEAMSMNEPGSIQAAEDWGVVLQSVPSKCKKEMVKRLVGIFQLNKHDAEKILSNVPLILVDNLSSGMAARVKGFFQKVGAVVETTNHDMIKKNCFQVLWPQTPDLSFFIKNEPVFAEPLAPEGRSAAGAVEIPPVASKVLPPEVKPETPEIQETAAPSKPVNEPLREESHLTQESGPKSIETDPKGEARAKEWNEKLRKLTEEKQALHAKHLEAAEKAKKEFQKRLDEEKRKNSGIAKAYEDLQKEMRKRKSSTQEGEEWRSKAAALAEKVRELETLLTQKNSEVEGLTQLKADLAQQSESAAAEVRRELSGLQGREQEFFQKIHQEKQELLAKHAEAIEQVKAEFRQLLEEEKKKSAEILRGYEDLQKEKQRHEVLTREGEEWRSRAVAMGERVHELETNLTQKHSDVERLIQEKEDIRRQAEDVQREIASLRSREQALQAEHAEALDRTRNESQQRFDEEKRKNEELAKACESFQQEKQRYESSTREGEEWRLRAIALDEKVRELETSLIQKNSEVEQLILQKEDLSRQSENAMAEVRREIASLQGREQEFHARHAEEIERVKNEWCQRLEAETRKSDDLVRACDGLQQEKQKYEASAREGEEWRLRAMALDEKVRELEASLAHKNSEVEHLSHQGDDLRRQVESISSELASRVAEFERTTAAKDEERNVLQGRVSDLERNLSDAQRELGNHQGREKDLLHKAGELEREIRETKEFLRARESAIAQLEKQNSELAEKVQEFESLRREHERLVQEYVTIRQECDAKLASQEARFAKLEEDHRRYRNRVDRKTASATREFGEWVRDVDAMRQGLQKLIVFLGSESVELDEEKNSRLKSPLTRGPGAPKIEKK
jgi:chromosome segregation ATPase